MSRKFKKLKSADRPLIVILALLVVGGFLIFLSASLGLIARGSASFSTIAFNQFFLGVVLGSVAAFITSRINYKKWRRWAFPFFVFTIIVTFAVFIPGIGMHWGGATRWIDLGVLTFQPVELLKFGTILAVAYTLSRYHRTLMSHQNKMFAVLIIGILLVATPLLLQPDTGSLVVIVSAMMAMFFGAGIKWRYVFVIIIAGILGIIVLAYVRPYVMDRINTFIHPEQDCSNTGYQVCQSLIAVGSGGFGGRGFGKSIQKFHYLPEPIGDSIFAVYAEEFGFVGSTILIILYFLLMLRMYYIAALAPDLFASLIVIGVATLIVVQSLFNISAMLGVAPLSGLPLIFVSHGGTALATTLAGIGIVINISRYIRRRA